MKNLQKYKLVILAGGYGTRLGRFTKVKPKPMVDIGGVPIIIHIINIYRKFVNLLIFIFASPSP